VAKKWERSFKFVLYVGIIYLNTTAKACLLIRLLRIIFGAERDGASPASTKKFRSAGFSLLALFISG